jgi:tetratricopeptide (TPR) repeat protein
LKPDFAAAYNNRGIAYMKAGHLAEAIRDYSRAIELQPGYADAFENRASAYAQNGQYEQALADVQKFQEKGGQPPPMFVEALLRATGRSK